MATARRRFASAQAGSAQAYLDARQFPWAYLTTFCTRDRGCSVHPAFPAPSDFEGEPAALGRHAPRERRPVFGLKKGIRG